MFLHIGGSQIVFDYELVGIFDINLAGGANIVAPNILKSKGVALYSDQKHKTKSLVLTDKDYYLSPIAPLTLAKRFNSRSKS